MYLIFFEEQSGRHILVSRTRDEVIERINSLAKYLAQNDKTYKQYIIRRKKDHELIKIGINALLGDFVSTDKIRIWQDK